MTDLITTAAKSRRAYWVDEVRKLSGAFGDDSDRLQAELFSELKRDGIAALLDHLRLCGVIPESYDHDSSEEKLYSKYTDALLSAAFTQLGMNSIVVRERADSADVEAVAGAYSLVADAKAFRLSRTAKNQKDFKVQAMDGWKRGKPFAIVVCPIYQLPARTSQIYEQASARNVCVFSYSHLAVLASFATISGPVPAQALLHEVLKAVSALNPSKDAGLYWAAVNRTMVNFAKEVPDLWKVEKVAALGAIAAGKEEALTFLAQERERLLRMSHEEALRELIAIHNIDSRISVIKAVVDNGILSVGH